MLRFAFCDTAIMQKFSQWGGKPLRVYHYCICVEGVSK